MLLKSPIPNTRIHGSALGLGAGVRRGVASTPTAPCLPGLPTILSPRQASINPPVKFGRMCTEHLSPELLVLISEPAQQPALLHPKNLPVLSST